MRKYLVFIYSIERKNVTIYDILFYEELIVVFLSQQEFAGL